MTDDERQEYEEFVKTRDELEHPMRAFKVFADLMGILKARACANCLGEVRLSW